MGECTGGIDSRASSNCSASSSSITGVRGLSKIPSMNDFLGYIMAISLAWRSISLCSSSHCSRESSRENGLTGIRSSSRWSSLVSSGS